MEVEKNLGGEKGSMDKNKIVISTSNALVGEQKKTPNMYRPTSRNEWWLCSVLFTQAILVIALEMYALPIFVRATLTRTPAIYLWNGSYGLLLP